MIRINTRLFKENASFIKGCYSGKIIEKQHSSIYLSFEDRKVHIDDHTISVKALMDLEFESDLEEYPNAVFIAADQFMALALVSDYIDLMFEDDKWILKTDLFTASPSILYDEMYIPIFNYKHLPSVSLPSKELKELLRISLNFVGKPQYMSGLINYNGIAISSNTITASNQRTFFTGTLPYTFPERMDLPSSVVQRISQSIGDTEDDVVTFFVSDVDAYVKPNSNLIFRLPTFGSLDLIDGNNEEFKKRILFDTKIQLNISELKTALNNIFPFVDKDSNQKVQLLVQDKETLILYAEGKSGENISHKVGIEYCSKELIGESVITGRDYFYLAAQLIEKFYSVDSMIIEMGDSSTNAITFKADSDVELENDSIIWISAIRMY